MEKNNEITNPETTLQVKTCKNCNENLTGNFCAHCGQKASVRRYSFKYFVENNIIHGIWNINSGFFFTIKQLFTRPGHSIREFINGKRIGYFNVITLLLIVVGFSHFIAEYTQVRLSDLVPENSTDIVNELEVFSKKYPKITLLLTIPFYTIFSFLWFKKSKLNLSEHLVLNSYKTAAELIMGLIFTVITIFYTNVNVLIIIYYIFVLLGSLVYSFWYYKQFFSTYGYSKTELIIRSLAAIFSPFILSTIIGVVISVVKIMNIVLHQP